MNNKYHLSEFQEFTGRHRWNTPQAFVTLTTLRFINLNTRICQEFLREEDGFVKLFYNPETKVIGIKLLSEADDNTYCLARKAGNHHASISAWGFVNYWKIDHAKTKRHEVTYDSIMHMIFFDLNKPIN